MLMPCCRCRLLPRLPACPAVQMSEPQLEDVARWCNRYPDISVNHQVADTDDIRAGEPVSLTVALEREAEGELRPVDAPRWAALPLRLCLTRYAAGGWQCCGTLWLAVPNPRFQLSLDALPLPCSARPCRYPGRKDENWWLVVGDTSANTLLAIKRVTLQVCRRCWCSRCCTGAGAASRSLCRRLTCPPASADLCPAPISTVNPCPPASCLPPLACSARPR